MSPLQTKTSYSHMWAADEFNIEPRSCAISFKSCERIDTSALHGLHLHYADRHRPNVLLKTAISDVSASHLSADANILFDEGAQRSFITQKLADDIQIQHKGTEEINLATFGGSSQTLRRVLTATVSLETSGRETIPIDVLIVPTIAAPLSNMPPEVIKSNHLKGLKLAFPVTQDGEFDISFLIGADHYWKIVHNHIIWTTAWRLKTDSKFHVKCIYFIFWRCRLGTALEAWIPRNLA